MTLRALVIAALVVVGARLGMALFWSQLYQSWWIFLLLPLAMIWLAGIGLAIVGIREALDRHDDPRGRWIMALAMPLALGIAWFATQPATWLGYRLRAEWMLSHDSLVAAAAGQRPPQAVAILRGVPDGGVSLIHAAADPRRWPAGRMIGLVGETFHRCVPIRNGWFVCDHH